MRGDRETYLGMNGAILTASEVLVPPIGGAVLGMLVVKEGRKDVTTLQVCSPFGNIGTSVLVGAVVVVK